MPLPSRFQPGDRVRVLICGVCVVVVVVATVLVVLVVVVVATGITFFAVTIIEASFVMPLSEYEAVKVMV